MILNQIDDIIARRTSCNSILLGTLERQQFLAALRITTHAPIEAKHINSGRASYKGFQVIPVDMPSFIAPAWVMGGHTNSAHKIKIVM